jgi:ABC-type transport system involved in cytochrome c biogenesis permease component
MHERSRYVIHPRRCLAHSSTGSRPASQCKAAKKRATEPLALDILAWDVFFPLAAVLGALVVQGSGLARLARALLFGSVALAFIGLAGVPLSDMNVRNIGIIGYVVCFPIAAVLLGLLCWRLGDQRAA